MLYPSRSTLPLDKAVERPFRGAVVCAVNAQNADCRALPKSLGQSNVAVNSRASSAPPASSRSTGTSGFSAGRGHHDLDDATPQVEKSCRRAASAGSMWFPYGFEASTWWLNVDPLTTWVTVTRRRRIRPPGLQLPCQFNVYDRRNSPRISDASLTSSVAPRYSYVGGKTIRPCDTCEPRHGHCTLSQPRSAPVEDLIITLTAWRYPPIRIPFVRFPVSGTAPDGRNRCTGDPG